MNRKGEGGQLFGVVMVLLVAAEGFRSMQEAGEHYRGEKKEKRWEWLKRKQDL